MMKQTLFKTWFAMLFLLVGVGTTWATTKTITVTISSFSGLPSNAAYSTYNWSQDGISGKATIYGSTSSANMQFNGSNRLFYSTSAVPGKILSVKLTKASGTDRAFCVYGRTDAYDGSSSTYGDQIGTSTTVTTSGVTFNVTSGNYNYFVVRNNTSNAAYLSSVEVTYEESSGPILSSIAVKTPPAKTTYTEGEKFDPAGLVITKTLSDATTADVTYNNDTKGDFTFDPSLETALTDETSVTITYGGKTTTQSITVNPFVATAGTYEIALNNVFFNCNAFTSKPSGFTSAAGTAKGVTITYNAASSAYINDSQCRIYKGTKLDFEAPEGFELTSIVLGTTTASPSISASIGSFSGKTWTGKATAVSLTGTQSSGNYSVTSVTVTYAVAVTPSVTAPVLDVDDGTYEGAKIVKVSNYDAALKYYYTTDGVDPTNASVTYNHATGITISQSCTLKVIAYDADNKTSNVTSADYTIIPVYASLAELVAAGAPTTAGYTVKVTLTDETILSFPSAKGLYLKSGMQEVQIYCSSTERPANWAIGGTLSGTLTCKWVLYGSSVWELMPSNWNDLTYTAPTTTKETATISATYATVLTAGEYDEYDVTYNGDGTLTVESSDEDVAEAIIDGISVLISAKAAGTTTITISAPATDNYYEASKSYTLTVKAPATWYAMVSEYEGKFFAVGSTVDNKVLNAIEVVVEDGKALCNAADKDAISWTLRATGAVENKAGKQISYSKGDVTLSDETSNYFEEATDDNGTYWKNDSRALIYRESANGFKNYSTSNAENSGYGTIAYVMPIEVANLATATMTINATAHYGTFCAPFEVTVPEGVSASIATVEGVTIQLTEVLNGAIPANTPVVVYAENGLETTSFLGKVVEGTPHAGNLTGVFEATAAPVGSYVLQKQGGVIGFYQVGETVPTVGANRAYLNVASDARVLTFGDDETAIDMVNMSTSQLDNKIYNLAGQRVNNAQKGIFIINGKKVVK